MNFKLDSVTLNHPSIASRVELFPTPPESIKLKCTCLLHETSTFFGNRGIVLMIYALAVLHKMEIEKKGGSWDQ